MSNDLVPSPYPGLFVTIEGPDGSGKSTVVDAAESRFDDVKTTAEPAEHLWTGEQARTSINDDDSHPLTDFHFFLGDRAHHTKETILPALKAGKTVISDRYSDSTRVYQSEILEGLVDNPGEYIENSLDQPWHLTPDITILIDITPEESARRTSSGDKYEASAFIQKVRQNYLDLEQNNPRIIRVDGEAPKEEVITKCLTIIEEAQIHTASMGGQ